MRLPAQQLTTNGPVLIQTHVPMRMDRSFLKATATSGVCSSHDLCRSAGLPVHQECANPHNSRAQTSRVSLSLRSGMTGCRTVFTSCGGRPQWQQQVLDKVILTLTLFRCDKSPYASPSPSSSGSCAPVKDIGPTDHQCASVTGYVSIVNTEWRKLEHHIHRSGVVCSGKCVCHRS